MGPYYDGEECARISRNDVRKCVGKPCSTTGNAYHLCNRIAVLIYYYVLFMDCYHHVKTYILVNLIQ